MATDATDVGILIEAEKRSDSFARQGELAYRDAQLPQT